MRINPVLLLCPLLLLVVFGAQAQSIEPLENALDPNVSITWPPPVYVLRGEVSVEGSASLDDLVNYFIEYRPLNDDLTPVDEDAAWLPVTLPNRNPVEDDVLGIWDTTTEADGIYELRLVINVGQATPVYFRVSPLRVENEGAPEVTVEAVPTQLVLPTIAPQATATAQTLPTLLPTPTAFDPTARVTSNLNANVRAGDNTNTALVGNLPEGESALIIGISNTGSGWYYIELPNGTRGWIAGGIVQVTGNLSNVPRIAPPATPTPTFTPTPTLPDVTITGVRYNRGEIREDQDFQIIVRVRNNSGVFLPDTQVLCTVASVGIERSSFVGTLNAFEERDVTLPALTLNEGGGSNITVNCAVDINQIVAELDENNNYFSITTPLRQP